MTTYQYTRRYAARYGDEVVTVPDQVAADQRGYAERDESFPARTATGETREVRIDAEATGLWTTGTGDLVVVDAAPRHLYQIISRTGQEMGTYEGTTPAEALLAMHRQAGYGPDVVNIDPDDESHLRFLDDGLTDGDVEDYGTQRYREMCGDVDDWTIREVEGVA